MSLLERTFAVVVNWNGGPRNLACVESLLAGGLTPERVVFVDNGSSDGSLAQIRGRYPGLLQLHNNTNLGFGVAANMGAREALAVGAEAVVFVNNDVTFPAETLGVLASVAELNPRVGTLGPRVLLPERPARLWAAGGMLTWRQNLNTLVGNGQLDGQRWRQTRGVDYVPGCALFMRRGVIEDVGLFDESYFAYLEDVELGVRAGERGYLALCVGEVCCTHSASSSTGGGYSARRKYLNGLNSVRFLRRHGDPAKALRFLLFDVLSLPILLAVALPRRRARATLAKALGILHGLLGRRATGATLEPGGTWLW